MAKIGRALADTTYGHRTISSEMCAEGVELMQHATCTPGIDEDLVRGLISEIPKDSAFESMQHDVSLCRDAGMEVNKGTI